VFFRHFKKCLTTYTHYQTLTAVWSKNKFALPCFMLYLQYRNKKTKAMKAKETKEKLDKKFIRDVASDLGHHNVSDKDVKQAHKYAIDTAFSEDYYYAVKEFFTV